MPGSWSIGLSSPHDGPNQLGFVAGWDGKLDCTPGSTKLWGGNVNTPYAEGALAGLKVSHGLQPQSRPWLIPTAAVGPRPVP